jgi:DNA-binding response OmpR family regulator
MVSARPSAGSCLVVKFQPEAVILDIQMPGIPGDDLARLTK